MQGGGMHITNVADVVPTHRTSYAATPLSFANSGTLFPQTSCLILQYKCIAIDPWEWAST
jgi:hypothetical protein